MPIETIELRDRNPIAQAWKATETRMTTRSEFMDLLMHRTMVLVRADDGDTVGLLEPESGIRYAISREEMRKDVPVTSTLSHTTEAEAPDQTEVK